MSLLDALLLDPYRINTWMAFRTDGVKGTGTQTDPWDGSTATKFDAIMNSLSANTTVHLGPATSARPFQTTGFWTTSDGSTGSGWQAKAGMRITGSGIEKLYRNPGLAKQYSNAGVEFARSLNWDNLMPQWLQLIRAAAGAEAPRSVP